jgi:integrase/recombinase XerD
MGIDIYNLDKTLSKQMRKLDESPILQTNKDLLLEYKSDCATGWGGAKLGTARITKHLGLIRICMEMNPGLDWMMISKTDIKFILNAIIDDPKKNKWSEYDYSVSLRKFINWMRREKGYPEKYPDRDQLLKNLPLLKYPLEVMGIKLCKPDNLPAAEDIPTYEEIRFICEAASHPRDKAFVEGAAELGPRVGGWGSRQIKHVVFDNLGAKITMTDKTMNNEPVRLVASAAYLRQWLELHPFKDDPESPVWIDRQKIKSGKQVAMSHSAILRMLDRLKESHNKNAQSTGKPIITKKITPHRFRYYAQTRDEKEGVPRSVMCRQRGWSEESRQPERYARISNTRVDEYYAERYGLESETKEVRPKPSQCIRCHEINPPGARFCYKCGMAMSPDAVQMEEEVRGVIDRMLKERQDL